MENPRISQLDPGGFSLVELMVVVAILGILSSVAIPAYVNYINRSTQADAVNTLMQVKMDQEAFYEQNFHYAGTIGCLPSCFDGSDTDCSDPTGCGSCSQASFITGKSYRVAVSSADTRYFSVAATRRYYTTRPVDLVRIASTLNSPQVANPDAIGFSLFEWVFK